MKGNKIAIKLLLYDGTINGVLTIEDSNWNSGKLFSVPRESIAALNKTDAFKRFGVYLLLSKDKVYIGQATDLAKRLNQHLLGKDWWERAIILTTDADKLNHTDIDYLEYILIEKAFDLKTLDCDNKRRGNPPKVDDFSRVILDNYLERALALMELIGIDVFSTKKNKKASTALIETVNDHDKSFVEKRSKDEAVRFLKTKGFSLGKNVNYATLNEGNGTYWVNPRKSCIETDWYLILNNQTNKELIVIHIPKRTLSLSHDPINGVQTRNDKPGVLNLKISAKSLIDSVSKVDFSRFEVQRVKY